jgi:H+/gluconate symporter-like permease
MLISPVLAKLRQDGGQGKRLSPKGLSAQVWPPMLQRSKVGCPMFAIAVILLALTALIALAWRGVSLVILAPALAVLAVLAAQGGPVLASYTQVFMQATGGFIIAYFPLFLLGAVFGKLTEATGAAHVMAEAIVRGLGPSRAVLAVVLSCAVLTYGGVSLFVVAFAVWPIAAALFHRADLPHVLIPAAIALGSFTFTMSALPGTPSIQNAIPGPWFGTSTFAAPGLGLVAAAIMAGFGMIWLSWRARRIGPGQAPVVPAVHGRSGTGPSLVLAVAPLVTVLGLNLLLTFVVFPRIDTSYLAQPAYGQTQLAALSGLWSIIAALTLASGLTVALNLRRLSERLSAVLDSGARDALLPIFNTASLVGFGAVIAGLDGFALLRDWVTGLSNDPVLSLAIGTSLLAGLTGSASGGMSIALGTLGAVWADMAAAEGVSPELMHRVTVLATGGLDALPHNGAVITLLGICGLTHRQAYGDIAMVAVVIPVVALCVVVGLGAIFGSF